MTGPGTREQLHRDVDALPEAELKRARLVVAEGPGEAAIAGVPAAWRTFPDGTPQPDWTAHVREDRDRGH
jgi:hypothetical protein